MPQNLDYALYFNIAFFGVIGLGFLGGYFRGLKKTTWKLVVLLLFYAFFFLSIDIVVNQLWITPMSQILNMASPYLPDIGNATTLGDAVFNLVEASAGDQIGDTMSNEVFIDFVTGLSLFVVKIIYAILYFTIGQVIFRFVFYLIRVIFFNGSGKRVVLDSDGNQEKLTNRQYKKWLKEEKKREKDRKKAYKKMSRKQKKAYKKDQKELKKQREKLEKKQKQKQKKPVFGAFVGAAKGAVTAFVSIILLGGFLNITESFLILIPEEQTQTAQYVEHLLLSTNTGPQYFTDLNTVPERTALVEIPSDMQNIVTETRNLLNGYNNNAFIKNANRIRVTDENYSDKIELNLYLFDTIFSFNIGEEKVLLRNELDVVAESASVVLNSEFSNSNDISDITGEEVRTVFVTMSESTLITELIPLGIDVGSSYLDVPLEIPTEDLYDIEWDAELQTLGAIASTAFDLISDAGLLTDDDLTTVTLDGEDVQDIFNRLGDSELATLGAYVAVEPLLEQAGGSINAIITVPAGMKWEDEFVAFGQVAKAILDTNITMGQLQEGDPNVLIDALSGMDFTILLNSTIVSHALRNIFDGTAGLEGLDMIVIPTNVNWFDTYDSDGQLIAAGELRNILTAVNSITTVASGFDFDNIDLNVIADFTDDAIDDIFGSEVLVATISDYLLNADLGDTPLIIPDSVLDENDYLLASELKAVATSARVLVTDLACDEGDTECENTGFDIAKAFNLDDTAIDTLTTSDILGATIGNLIIDNGGDILVIPPSALMSISVDDVLQDVVSKQEIKNVFKAVGTLGFTDLDNMTFDASIISNLETAVDSGILDTDKSTKLFNSILVHATLSDMLIEQAAGDSAVLTVPYFAQNNDVIRTEDLDDPTIEYVSTTELNSLLQSLITLDISDFANVDSLDINNVIADADTLLESSILQATISTQVFDLGTETINVPYQDVDGNDVRITVGDDIEGTDTIYIDKEEIIAILDSLEILDITDINSFDGAVDIADIVSDENNITTMLLSATLHATISGQLINLDTDGIISVPYFEEDNSTSVRVSVGPTGNETEFIEKDEIRAMLDVLDLLEITENLDNFDGAIDMGTVLADPANYDILLASSTIHATISKQLFDLETDGTLEVPYFSEAGDPVRVTVGDGVNPETNTDYMTEVEVRAMLDVLDLLGIAENLENFDGAIDMETVLADPANYDILLASSTIHATISKQLFDLETDGTLEVPYFSEAGDPVRVTVGDGVDPETNTDYMTEVEVRAMLDVLDLLEIAENLENFDGAIDMETILADPANYDTLLASSTIQATISKQLYDLNTDETLVVPYVDEDSLAIRVTVGDPLDETDTNYILETELRALLDALNALDLTENLDQFDGQVDIASAAANKAVILASSIIQATISKQMIDLDTSDSIVLPFFDEDNVAVRVTVGDPGEETEFVSYEELDAIITAMDILGIVEDISSFSPSTVDLSVIGDPSDPTPAQNVFSSAMIQATVSDQLLNLTTNDTFVVPYLKYDDTTDIRFERGSALEATEYILSDELIELVQVLDLLNITDIETFTGEIDLDVFFDPANRTQILESSTMQATISAQMLEIGETTLPIPYKDIDEVIVRKTVADGDAIKELEYISVDEIDAMFGAFKELDIKSFDDFTGVIDISVLDTTTKQNAVLASASVHAKISELLTTLNSDVLIVPMYSQDGATIGNEIRIEIGSLGFTTEFVVKAEIRALMDSFTLMGYDDLNSFPAELDSSVFFDNRTTLLLSSSIQATISDKMINGTSGELIVPDVDVNTGDDIRILVSGTTFIEVDEVNAILNALDAIGLTDFTSLTFNPATIFAGDNIPTLLASPSLQATISSKILPSAGLETAAAGTTNLLVPSIFRETITIDSASSKHIEKAELQKLLESLEALGVSDFNGGMNASTITNMTDTELDTLLNSASVHTTVDNMLRGNAALSFPELAEVSPDPAYKSNIITREEIKLFIKATTTATTTSSFTDVTFSPAVIAGLTPTEQGIVADSMIVRDTLTPTIETVVSADPFNSFVAADYMNDDITTFLKKQSLLDAVNTYY